MSAPTLAVVTAGLSQPSSTRLLADRLTSATQRELAARGQASAAVTVIELRDLAHDITDQLLTGFGRPALRTAIEQVTTADGLIAVTPLYSGSYSGLFKSFFDILEPGALDRQPALIAATGGTARHSLALEHAVRPLFSYLRAVPVPTAVFAATADWGDSGAEGRELNHRIDRAAAELAAAIAPAALAPTSLALAAKTPATTAPPSQLRSRRSQDPFASVTPFEDLLNAR
jgi:FMN reductase